VASGDVFFPFNAVAIGVAPNVNYDREFDAADFADYFGTFLGTGVYPNPSSNFRVSSLNNNFTLTIGAGRAFVIGYYARIKENATLVVTAPEPVNRRIDSIVLRLNLIDRGFNLLCVKGTPAGSPVAPALVRNDDYYDIRLAEVSVRAGAASILSSDITDTRPLNAVCGWVTGLVTQVDTTALFDQYASYYNQKKAEYDQLLADQKTAGTTQLTNQQTAFDTAQSQRAANYAAWRAAVDAELQTYTMFNFDNWAAFSFTTIELTFPTGKMRNEMFITGSSPKKMIAYRETDWATMSTREVVYAADGVTIIRDKTKPLEFLPGVIRSVIT